MHKCILLIFHLLWVINIKCDDIHTEVQWKRLQFAYKTDEDRRADVKAGKYDPDAPTAIDVDVYYSKTSPYQRTLFVTIPKFSKGVPVTFGIVTNKLYNGDPLIKPFPSWDWHRDTSKCKKQRLVSVFRVKIDRCGLLWILDSGNEGEGVICKPQIVVFDLKQWPDVKQPLYTYEYPSGVYTKNSVFVTPIVESVGKYCNEAAYIYAADTSDGSIVYTNLNSFRSQRYKHSSMNPETAFSTFNIAGSTFDLDDGVLGMDLSPNGRYLYYSPLSGSRESRLDTLKLKRNLGAYIQSYKTPRKSQSAAMAINKNGIALFGLMSDISINCWNTNSDDYGNNIKTVYVNNETMQFASGAKIVQNSNGKEEFWVLTSRLQKEMTTGYNFTEVNFRISMGRASALASKCYH